ncbi:MAG: Nitrogen regulatory protein [Chlamydiae bacterium]|nr:Nitrogen regulatory protein [Chlamydiota bacterium]
MDLEIKDVAELLNISEITVQKWIEEGRIPAYRLHKEYRFSRSEIEDWLMQQKLAGSWEEEESHTSPSGAMQFNLYRALYRGEVIDEMEGGTKEEIIHRTMEKMSERVDLDPEVLSDLFLDREKMMSTALGSGIAIPHTRDFLLDTHYDEVLVVYPKNPLPYDALDGQPVHTLFFLFACEDRHHLSLLSKIAHLCAQEKARAFLQTRPPKERLLDYIKHWESSLSH